MDKVYKPVKPDKDILLADADYMIYELLLEILKELKKLNTK